jgi:hypothetical protein
MGAPKVFISYRREETAGHSGRLYDVMSTRFGDSKVFMDVDIAPGVDFVSRITEAVGDCHVLLVIMGPRWATASNSSTLPRIFDPDDFVRLEVQTGLQRSDVAVIPVLVAGAKMPEPTALPAPLRPLTRRNAIELSDTRWRYDVDRLLAALDGLLKDTSAVHQVPPSPAVPPAADTVETPPQWPGQAPPAHGPPAQASPIGRALLLAATTTGVGMLAAVVGRAVANVLRWDPTAKAGKVLQPVALQGLTWALVGAAVAMWLSAWARRGDTGVGPLFLGALAGAAAGGLGSAISAVPKYLLNNPPTDSHQEWIAVAGVGVTGALLGALIGWAWRRRGSAGLVAGLLAGGFIGLLLKGASDATDGDRVKHALAAAFVIVGFVTLTQALLDARGRDRPLP